MVAELIDIFLSGFKLPVRSILWLYLGHLPISLMSGMETDYPSASASIMRERHFATPTYLINI